jgi:alkane 1-monooxygenase
LLAVVYAFVVIPLLDLWTGDDDSAAPPGKLTPQTRSHFRELLKLYPLVHFTMLLTVIHLVASPTGGHAFSNLGVLGLTLSLGVGASMSFTVAHELLHSTDDVERNLSTILLLPNFYMHWGRAHLQHHAHVGTPKDPTTSRRGETVFAFWMRSIVGNLINAFRAEWKRPKGGNVLMWIVAPLALLLATYVAYGGLGAAVLVGQAMISVLMLETVNYIEHYGLVRENKGAVLPKHSWNSSTSFGNAVTFNLQRHSDHHASAQKPYFVLESIEDAPQLPAGYPGMY